ncbi:AMP-binding protein [Nitratireductor pacificus]|uniref:AMP-dependent synthetase and ligase n=1 Tax=Nitratireductor pacificus pht-3B TaxID=391937 RepID=K2N1Q7_9HYPH|nr:AMP-binding protein [Nitratireductor pacificus]EKF18118.1 AMP-dependent synthetase and ligase [Nitratireductor pacificus pht-3B]
MTSEIPPHDTVFAAFDASARRWPQRPFLNVMQETADIYGIPAGEILYGAALEEIERLRDAYRQAGYRTGMRVMLLMENRPAFFLHWFALNALGLSVVPVNPDLQSAELEYMAGHSRPVLAVAIASRVADLEKAAEASGAGFPVMTPEAAPPAVVPRLAGLERPGGDALAREAAMLYTSGTTGKPKGCVLSNLYFLHSGGWYARSGGICAMNEDGERMITPLPIFHMNAMAYSLMAMVTVGGCLTALDRFHPRSWWQSVRDSRATCLHYLGVMPSMLMKAASSPDDRAHAVRFGFGAGIDAKLHGPFEERFGIPLVEGWAMTETGAGAVIVANHEPRKRGTNCLGQPGPDIEARVVADDGSEAAAGEPGELLVRHAGEDPRFGFFSEYYANPEATAEAWEGGWFHTGDIVMRDADGDFFFVDRKKNVIRRSGENIAAVEVESFLMQHPEIRAAAVAAAPDELRGDEVFACLVVDGERNEARARAIAEWCLERVAYYKVPGYIAFVDALPLTSTQKIQRSELKALVTRLLDDPATTDTRAMKKRRAA